MKDRANRKQLIFLLITFCMLVLFSCTPKKDNAKTPFPTYWQPSSPEEQGVDSGILLEMLQEIEAENIQEISVWYWNSIVILMTGTSLSIRNRQARASFPLLPASRCGKNGSTAWTGRRRAIFPNILRRRRTP